MPRHWPLKMFGIENRRRVSHQNPNAPQLMAPEGTLCTQHQEQGLSSLCVGQTLGGWCQVVHADTDLGSCRGPHPKLRFKALSMHSSSTLDSVAALGMCPYPQLSSSHINNILIVHLSAHNHHSLFHSLLLAFLSPLS